MAGTSLLNGSLNPRIFHVILRHAKRLPSLIITSGRVLTENNLISIYQVKKVHIHAVGIGRSIRESELAKLAGDTGDYCHVTNFKKLNTILEKLRDAACGMVFLLSCFSCNIHRLINTLNTLKSP